MPEFLYSPAVAFFGSGHPDFNIFYNAGWLWLHGEQNPYTLILIGKYVYPPPSLPFFGLYALLNIVLAAQVWMVTYFVLFTVALVVLALPIERERRSLFVSITSLLFFTSFPLLIMMALGQSDLFISSLALLSLAALRLKRVTASAILLSAATLMKGPSIFLLIYFAVYRRDLNYLLRFIASTAGIVLVSLLVIPTRVYYSYFVIVAPMMSIAAPAEMNESITGVLTMAGMSNLSSIVALVGLGLFGSFAFYVGSKKLNVSRDLNLRDDALFVMNVLIMLALGPRSWPANYVWVILPVALLVSGLITKHVKTLFLISMGIAAFLLNASLTQRFLNYSMLPSMLPFALAGNVIMILMLIPACIRPSILGLRSEIASK